MCLYPQSSDLHFVWHLSIRYFHDGSETVEDDIEFTATDGTNSVSFVIHVKVSNVGPFGMDGLGGIKTKPIIFFFTKKSSMSFPGEPHQ